MDRVERRPGLTPAEQDMHSREQNLQFELLQKAQREYFAKPPQNANEIVKFFTDRAETMGEYIHLLQFITGLLRRYADETYHGHTLNATYIMESGYITQDLQSKPELALVVVDHLQNISQGYNEIER